MSAQFRCSDSIVKSIPCAYAVWRVLRREGIYRKRLRSWCVSTDKKLAPKAAEVVGLYLDPPLNEMVLSVDEKPSIRAIERPSGYVQTDSGVVVRALKSTYKRHGTLNLFAALEVGTGQVHTKFTEYKKRQDFRSFLEDVLADQPPDKEVHVILDNYCTHKKHAQKARTKRTMTGDQHLRVASIFEGDAWLRSIAWPSGYRSSRADKPPPQALAPVLNRAGVRYNERVEPTCS